MKLDLFEDQNYFSSQYYLFEESFATYLLEVIRPSLRTGNKSAFSNIGAISPNWLA